MNKFFQKNIGLAVVVILALLPVAEWTLIQPLGVRFLDLNTTMTSLGQLTGLVGMTLFSISLILAGRFRFLDSNFYGLNRVYEQHHKLGAIAFILLLFHPLFLAVKYLSFSIKETALFLLPGSNLPVNFGIIGLGLMMILMVLTFYIKLKYPHWKISHKFMVLVFVFAILHSVFIFSDISRDLNLRIYILGMASLGLLVGFYQAFVKKYLKRDFEYMVEAATPLSANTVSIKMKAMGRALKFQAGQFVFVRFKSFDLTAESHPFSICSSPAEADLELVVKALGEYTADLPKLKIGDKALIEGPFGKFSYKNTDNSRQVWLAGGVGITPFMSMAKDLKNSDYKIDLYYCVNDRAEAVLLQELTDIAASNKNFRVFAWCSKDQGRITAEAVAQNSGEIKNKDILLCGPEPFMIGLRQQFLKLKVPGKQIHWERFNFL